MIRFVSFQLFRQVLAVWYVLLVTNLAIILDEETLKVIYTKATIELIKKYVKFQCFMKHTTIIAVLSLITLMTYEQFYRMI